MATNDELLRIPFLFHFTDRRNLASIRELGGLYPLAMLEEMGVAIPAPGGNQWSQEADGLKGLKQYVHLCFRNNHPMEFVARQESRLVDSIFLQIHPEVLTWNGVRFTPDVSNKSGVPIQTLAEAIIDLAVLYSWTNWHDPAIKQRLDMAERCEVLVPAPIPVGLIRNLPDG